jgi:hypothetical protein
MTYIIPVPDPGDPFAPADSAPPAPGEVRDPPPVTGPIG